MALLLLFQSPMKSIFHLAIIIIFSNFLGCSEDKKGSSEGLGPVVTFNHPAGTQSGDIYCEKNCPSYVGAMIVYHNPREVSEGTYYDYKLCSVTLIEKDKVVTNRHCLENIISQGQKCHDGVKINIKFPKNKIYSSETVQCDQILEASRDLKKRFAPDWIIIKLKKEAIRRPISSIKSGPQKNRPVQLFPVYFDKSFSVPVAVIRPVRCRQKVNNPANIFSFEEIGSQVTVENCNQKLVNGSSGAGIFSIGDESFIGIHASTAGEQDHGTAAQCLPGLKTDEQSCFFSSNGTFTQAAKHISFMGYAKEKVGPLLGGYDWQAHGRYGWSEENLLKEAPRKRSKIKIFLSEEWESVRSYIATQDESLHIKYVRSFKELHFPRLPRCFRAKNFKKNIKFPVLSVDWELNEPQKWFDGGLGVASVLNWKTLNAKISKIKVTVISKTKQKVVLEMTGHRLPIPIERVEIRLPICKIKKPQ